MLFRLCLSRSINRRFRVLAVTSLSEALLKRLHFPEYFTHIRGVKIVVCSVVCQRLFSYFDEMFVIVFLRASGDKRHTLPSRFYEV